MPGVDLQAVGLIGRHALRQLVRERILLLAGAGAALLLPAYWLVGQLATGQDVKILKDLGLGAGAAVGLLVAVLGGSDLAGDGAGRGAMQITLAKPVRRHEWILGQFAGLALALACALGIVAAALYALLAGTAWRAVDAVQRAGGAPVVDPALLQAYFLLFMELLILTAGALLFAVVARRLLAVAMTAGLYVAGHFGAELRGIGDVVDSSVAALLATGLAWILPDLASFGVAGQVVHGQPVPAAHILLATGHALAYVAALLTGAALLFARRDLA